MSVLKKDQTPVEILYNQSKIPHVGDDGQFIIICEKFSKSETHGFPDELWLKQYCEYKDQLPFTIHREYVQKIEWQMLKERVKILEAKIKNLKKNKS